MGFAVVPEVYTRVAVDLRYEKGTMVKPGTEKHRGGWRSREERVGRRREDEGEERMKDEG